MKEAPEAKLLQLGRLQESQGTLQQKIAVWEGSQHLVREELFLARLNLTGTRPMDLWVIINMHPSILGAGEICIPVRHCSPNPDFRGIREMSTLNIAQLNASNFHGMEKELQQVFGSSTESYTVFHKEMLDATETIAVRRSLANGQTDLTNEPWRVFGEWKSVEKYRLFRLSLMDFLAAVAPGLPQHTLTPQPSVLFCRNIPLPL